MNIRKILITGAHHGHVNAIVRFLSGHGFDVSAFCKNEQPGSLDSLPVKVYPVDLMDPASYEDILKHQDLIIHGDTLCSFNPSDKVAMYRQNVLGTRDLVNAALSQNVSSILFLSDLYTLSRSSKPGLLALNNEGNPFFFNEYCKTLFHAELEIHRAEAEGIQTAIMHPAWLVDPSSPTEFLPARFLKGYYGASTEQPYHIAWLTLPRLLDDVLSWVQRPQWEQMPLVSGLFQLNSSPFANQPNFWLGRTLIRLKNQLTCPTEVKNVHSLLRLPIEIPSSNQGVVLRHFSGGWEEFEKFVLNSSR